MNQKRDNNITGVRDVRSGMGEMSGGIAALLQSALLMDSLACALLTAGSAAALSEFTVFANDPAAYLMLAAAAAAVTAALSRRWWLAPAAAVCAAVYAAAGWVYAGGEPYWRPFLTWIASGAVYLEGVTEPGFLTVTRALVVFAIAPALFALIRKLFCFPVLLALQAAALILPGVAVNADMSAPLCMCAAGLIILLPRVYARRIERSGVTAEGRVVLRARMQAVAVPAAALAVAASMLFIPENTGAWKSRRLGNLINDLGMVFNGPFGSWPEASSNFNLYRFGFQPDAVRLGGPVRLGGNKILEVACERPVLLRGRVLDYYTGDIWLIAAPDGDMRFGSLLMRGYRRAAFDADKPYGSKEAARLYDRLTTAMDINIWHEDSTFTTLFAAGAVSSVSFDRRLTAPEAYFNMRSELYMHARMPWRAGYTVRTRVWNTGMRDFDALFVSLERLTGADARYDAIFRRYTQLPESLPPEVRAAADDITRDAGSPYLKAQAISRWLAENFEYTLEPEMPPEGVDFTAWFIESGEGYCVYYATAMTVLARCAGLPARYVQGFALESIPGAGRYQATGKTAHAWSEVYFEGIGWLPVDPLSWSAEEPMNEELPLYEPEIGYSQSQTSHSGPSVTPYVPDEETQAASDAAGRPWPWGAILTAAAMAALTVFAVRAAMGAKKRQWTLERVRRRYAGTSAQLGALYADTLRLLKLCGLEVMPGETLETFPERVDLHIKFNGAALKETACALSLMEFAGAAPSEADAERACLYHALLEAHVLELIGKTQYLFRRALRRGV
ncbi:MAG: transglutaminase-like domain-containing protein [Oscillospiraceae bacterium]|nr:transglutaminase-like domain-containing protein [Oscillospiraceae bacterium]